MVVAMVVAVIVVVVMVVVMVQEMVAVLLLPTSSFSWLSSSAVHAPRKLPGCSSRTALLQITCATTRASASDAVVRQMV
jgi:hypothetical protein